ncbi:hypothetical protein GYMLUDRAFT_248001 [Collybiopsis luxurians FD-317 M1]|uniref:Uncharacterized protein n=1 Tax=Collybiopsis luxurians FD-317 M1 TaxID=944289 RepID=A0A0D0CDV8_9AGAR|nr:hypothetical protein GYMLUDRAFT_248001 [Collybiopsis luxurians FD-317 M1]
MLLDRIALVTIGVGLGLLPVCLGVPIHVDALDGSDLAVRRDLILESRVALLENDANAKNLIRATSDNLALGNRGTESTETTGSKSSNPVAKIRWFTPSSSSTILSGPARTYYLEKLRSLLNSQTFKEFFGAHSITVEDPGASASLSSDSVCSVTVNGKHQTFAFNEKKNQWEVFMKGARRSPAE